MLPWRFGYRQVERLGSKFEGKLVNEMYITNRQRLENSALHTVQHDIMKSEGSALVKKSDICFLYFVQRSQDSTYSKGLAFSNFSRRVSDTIGATVWLWGPLSYYSMLGKMTRSQDLHAFQKRKIHTLTLRFIWYSTRVIPEKKLFHVGKDLAT